MGYNYLFAPSHIFQVLLFQLPLIYCLNHLMSHDRHASGGKNSLYGCCHSFYHVVIVVLSLAFQCLTTISIVPYGLIALVLCPGITWSIPLSVALIWRAFRMNS